jgi:hypothetical protein
MRNDFVTRFFCRFLLGLRSSFALAAAFHARPARTTALRSYPWSPCPAKDNVVVRRVIVSSFS